MKPDPWREWQAFWSGDALGGERTAAGFAPFLEIAEKFTAAAGDFLASASAGPSSTAADALGTLMRDLSAGLFKPPGLDVFGRAAPAAVHSQASAPVLGMAREQVLHAQRAIEAWARLTEAHGRLQRLWSDALREAAGAFSARIQTTAPSAPATPSALYDAWIECAEEAYERTAHGEAFCDALADCVNASSQWRLESGVAAEQWAKLLDLPTRREINTLERRLRSLEQELASLKTAGERKAAPMKPRRARRRST